MVCFMARPLAGFGGGGITVFRLATDGSGFTTLAQGGAKVGLTDATLTRGSDGNLYGTDRQGGTISDGSIFQMTPDWRGDDDPLQLPGHARRRVSQRPAHPGGGRQFLRLHRHRGRGFGGYDLPHFARRVITRSYIAWRPSGATAAAPTASSRRVTATSYGTADQGGDPNYPPSGTVFRFTPGGVFTKLLDLGEGFGVNRAAVGRSGVQP